MPLDSDHLNARNKVEGKDEKKRGEKKENRTEQRRASSPAISLAPRILQKITIQLR